MTMELKKIILYLCVCTVACYPTKPLNDRPSELAWQAWLLFDSQSHADSDRRITPKSVFIAPNLGNGNGNSNGSFPDCAEGYRSDPMGRCIKYVKVDEAAHLDFLLQRLNAMYATKSSDDHDDDAKPTSGPLQLNIPFGGAFSTKDEDNSDNEPEVAVIVAPTNGNFDVDSDKEANEQIEDIEEEIDPESELAIFVAPLNRNFNVDDEKDKTNTESYPEDFSIKGNDKIDVKKEETQLEADSDITESDIPSTNKNFNVDEDKRVTEQQEEDEDETSNYPSEITSTNKNLDFIEKKEESNSEDTLSTTTNKNFYQEKEVKYSRKRH